MSQSQKIFRSTPDDKAVDQSIELLAKFKQECSDFNDYFNMQKFITEVEFNQKRPQLVDLMKKNNDNFLEGVNENTITFNEFKKRTRSRQAQLQALVDIHTAWQQYKSNPRNIDKTNVARDIAACTRAAMVCFDRTPKMERKEVQQELYDAQVNLFKWAIGILRIDLKGFTTASDRKSTFIVVTPDAEDIKLANEKFSELLKVDGIIEHSFVFPTPELSPGKVAGAVGVPFFITGLVLMLTNPPVGVLYCLGYAFGVAATSALGWFMGGAIEKGIKNSRFGEDDGADKSEDYNSESENDADSAAHSLSNSVQKHLAQHPVPASSITKRRATVTVGSNDAATASSSSLKGNANLSAAAKNLVKTKAVGQKTEVFNQHGSEFADLAKRLKEKEQNKRWYQF